MMHATLAIVSIALIISVWQLVAKRKEALRLHDQIQSFLNGEVASPAFSVRDNHFAMFEDAVIELETRLLQARESAREQSAKSQAFVQDVSHQFKTPIAGLRLFCEIDECAHKEQKLQLVERMEALIGSLLTLEKLRSDGYEFEYKMCNLLELALDVKAQFMPLYPQKQISVTGDAGIRCDAYWMFEVLANIVKNACEHTPADGDVRISIQPADGEVLIRVEDDGGGVPPEALSRLFDRFYRSSQPADGRGVGLGLAIAKTITIKHHGSIRAENGERGLLISIYLPLLHANLKKT